MTWTEWMDWHATTFGLRLTYDGQTPSDEAKMLRGWSRLFAEQGFSPEDTLAASRALALSAEPLRPRDHLAALLRAVRGPRREAASVPPPADGCQEGLCGGTGRVHVPDPDKLAERKVCVVYCRCPLGRWFRNSAPNARRTLGDGTPRELRIWTVDDVEEALPDWRQYLAIWAQERAAEARALGDAGALDRVLGRIMAGIRLRRTP